MHKSADRGDIVGDGIHDDTVGQAPLDAGTSTVHLATPPKHCRISRTLVIHSGQTLRMGNLERAKQ